VTAPRFAEIAARLLAASRRGDAPAPTAGARANAIGAIADAIATNARRRARRRWVWLGVAAAAVAAIASGVMLRPTGGASLARSLPNAMHVAVLRVDGSDVRVVDVRAHGTYALAAGSVRARVSKLAAGERFVVETPDAEVVVHGTVFRVEVVPSDPACGDGVRTRVTVEDGVVSVRHGASEDYVRAGGSWPEGCHEAPAASLTPTSSAVQAEASTPPSTSHLAQQNDAFQRAMAARRRGANAEALALLNQLIVRYPDGPLAESARAERARILTAADAGAP
jgi:hypothetical protein